MMEHEFSRTELLLGSEAMAKLRQSSVIIFGLGGVGSYVVEALARSGVGRLILVDHDAVSLTNLNRQILATHETLGRYKADVAAERVRAINPAAQVEPCQKFLLPENADEFPLHGYDYIVDAVDTVSAKLVLAEKAERYGVPIISSMGTGNKLDPSRFEFADIYDTSVCPLARVMRRELKARGVQGLKVLYSKEPPLTSLSGTEGKSAEGERPVPGSVSFVPSVAGLMIAGAVVRDLIC